MVAELSHHLREQLIRRRSNDRNLGLVRIQIFFSIIPGRPKIACAAAAP
jgi:hypothetical protein